jgi:pimeloyl-ACP methyl ester carboxylesterase
MRIRTVLFQVAFSWLASSTLSRKTSPAVRTRRAACLLLAATPLVAQAAPASLAFEPYAFQTQEHGAIDAEVAFLEVPARHAEPGGAAMRLRVVRLPATGGDGKAAPVVYLAGGPGGSGVGTARGARWPVFDQVRQHTDVLLFDQRGTGESNPPPACPHTHRFDDAQPLQRDAALVALRNAAARCVAYWQEQGIDLAAYTSAESADDIEALRVALGAPKLSLWGMSYGTHLAIATLRRHGAGIERTVLMGAEGPDDTLKLPLSADALLAELEAAAAKEGFTDLSGAVTRVLASLQQQPAQARSLIHRGRQVTLGAFDVQLAISAAVGRRSSQQLLPLALRDAELGNYDLLASLVLMVRDELQSVQAMPLAMELASAQSPQRRALVEKQAAESLLGNTINFPFPELGDTLGLIDLGDDYRAPLHSDVPTLFVSGTLDGRTPPANAAALLPGFSHAAQLLVRNASHDDELWLGNPDISASIARFLAGQPVSSAELSVPPPVFARSKLDLLAGLLGVSAGMLLTGVGVLIAALLGIVALLWRLRKKRRARKSRLATANG